MAVLSCHHIMYLRGILPKKVIFHLQMLENMFIIQLSVLHFIWKYAMNTFKRLYIIKQIMKVLLCYYSQASFTIKQNIVNN